MSRNTGPKFKKARKLKMSFLENNKEFLKTKKRSANFSGKNVRPKKMSNFGKQLCEKQKLKNLYGITERQLKNSFTKVSHMKGVVGENLFILLESRLDNIVFRLNLAPTRSAARQLVNHKHIKVNNKIISIPSYVVNVGDKIELVSKMHKNKIINESIKSKVQTLEFIELDKNKFSGKYKRLPRRDELTSDIQESFIVELFSR